MTKAKIEENPINENDDKRAVREPPRSAANAPNDGLMKTVRNLKFSKLWVRKKNANVPVIPDPENCCSLAKLGLKENPRVASASVEATSESNRSGKTIHLENQKEDEEKSINASRSINKCDASTETLKTVRIDVQVSCQCDTVSRASGSDTLIEICCVGQDESRPETNDTNEALESVSSWEKRRRGGREEKRADKWRRRSSSPVAETSSRWSATTASLEEFLDNGELMDDRATKCFPYPIESRARSKPGHVAKHESFRDSFTENRSSMSHEASVVSLGVGSSIIIDVPSRTYGTDAQEFPATSTPKIRKSASSGIADGCRFCERRERHRNRYDKSRSKRRSVESTESSFDEDISSDRNRPKSQKRKNRRTSFASEYEDSSVGTDGDFTVLETIVESDDRGKRGERSIDRSDGGYGRKSSGRSSAKIVDTFESRSNEKSRWKSTNDSGNDSWLDDASGRGKLRRRPLHESSRLSLRTIEDSWRTLLPALGSGSRGIGPSGETELSASSGQTKILDRVAERGLHARTRDSDEIILGRHKPRSSQLYETSERRGVASIKKRQIFCKNDPFPSAYNGEGPFAFNLRKLTDLGNCKLFEFDDPPKCHETNRFVAPNPRGPLATAIFVDPKTCKCGNGCGVNLRNKRCCCHG